MGFNVRLTRPVKSKITRFAPFSSVSQAGFVHIVKADWNKAFFDELEIFNGDRANKDDQVDCCSDAMVLLNKDTQLPSFTLPDFTGTNPFDGSISGNNIPSYNGVTIG
jgi:phage terminase large subunit-like protein